MDYFCFGIELSIKKKKPSERLDEPTKGKENEMRYFFIAMSSNKTKRKLNTKRPPPYP